MHVRILGAGFYGCHIALTLKNAGHNVEIHERNSEIFTGASGNIPARLHLGFHYPRSRMTRAACLDHTDRFMEEYGAMTRGIATNIYAIADHDSLVDFHQYLETLSDEVEFIHIYDPKEFGLQNVEGALLTGERHIVTDKMKKFFLTKLWKDIRYNIIEEYSPENWDYTIDCTFSANSDAGVDRYEPCLVPLVKAPVNKAVTIMDGPFGSLYPWNPEKKLCSLSSAKYTPLSKTCKTWQEAYDLLESIEPGYLMKIAQEMKESIAYFYPEAMKYNIVDLRTSIRAMPRSGADTRLVDIRQEKNRISIRAGKIDAIFHAADAIMDIIGEK